MSLISFVFIWESCIGNTTIPVWLEDWKLVFANSEVLPWFCLDLFGSSAELPFLLHLELCDPVAPAAGGCFTKCIFSSERKMKRLNRFGPSSLLIILKNGSGWFYIVSGCHLRIDEPSQRVKQHSKNMRFLRQLGVSQKLRVLTSSSFLSKSIIPHGDFGIPNLSYPTASNCPSNGYNMLQNLCGTCPIPKRWVG